MFLCMGHIETIIGGTDVDLRQDRDGSRTEVNSGVYIVKIVGRERDPSSQTPSYIALYRNF